MITPPLISSAESNGDIYYSTFLRFVKRLSEDFSKILRSGLPTTSLHPASTESNFEENTGLLQNRYLIIYTQKSTLSSKIPNKSQKNMVHATNGAGRQDNSHITLHSSYWVSLSPQNGLRDYFIQLKMRARLRVTRSLWDLNMETKKTDSGDTTFFCKKSVGNVNNSQNAFDIIKKAR